MTQEIVTSWAKALIVNSSESARLKPRPFKATYFINGLRTQHARERVIRITALVLVISSGFLMPMAAAQSDQYSKMAPVDQYLMGTS